jgi:murein L,D-transpeptidase YafK
MMLMKNHRILKVYHVSLGRNPVGKKTRKDDGKTPEGHYVIDWRNPQSRYHLSLHISYPDQLDTLRAWTHGASPGGSIMIHGVPNGREHQEKVFQQNDWTDGCIAVTNKEIDEIWKNVTNGTPIEIRP